MHTYLLPLKECFEINADNNRSKDMVKYMKNQMQFYGISSGKRGEILNSYLKTFGKPVRGELRTIIEDLWTQPQREYQYFANELLRKCIKDVETDWIEWFFFMITTRSWWDTVDFIASNLVGPYFVKFPEKKEKTCLDWVMSGNIWLQRSVLLFQLKYRKNTDVVLLTDAIEKLAGSKNFFIRKAIGWALREYSKVNIGFVETYVEQNKEKLSPLSKREALKFINKKRME